MADVPRTGDSWYIIGRNITAGGQLVTDETEDAAVTYTLRHKGVFAGSGALAWEAHNREDAWVAMIGLPATPGVLTIELTASATIDGDTLIGTKQTSLKVV